VTLWTGVSFIRVSSEFMAPGELFRTFASPITPRVLPSLAWYRRFVHPLSYPLSPQMAYDMKTNPFFQRFGTIYNNRRIQPIGIASFLSFSPSDRALVTNSPQGCPFMVELSVASFLKCLNNSRFNFLSFPAALRVSVLFSL